jgi:BON domain
VQKLWRSVMKQRNFFSAPCMLGVLSAFLLSTVAFAQAKPATIPDAQIEANVLKVLAGAPQLASQSIMSTTVFGTVTLSGSVTDEASRDLAEKLVSNTTGVQKVVDQMTVGGPAAVSSDTGQGASNPNLQSDGTVAPPDQSQAPQAQANVPPPPPAQNQSYPPQQPQNYPPPPQQQQAGQNPYPQSYPPTYRQPYYAQPQQPYVAQRGGDAVVVPSGSVVRVRIDQKMDSKHTVTGATFSGVVLTDVMSGGFIAIPRGAAIQGTVVDSHPAGELKGKGELKLQLTQVTFGGRMYPIATDFWWHQGLDKTGNTVGNTVGLASVGALIGAVAGGGVGAAVGAGVGGIAGLGVSSASGKGEASLPAEAIVTFHLTQPADVTTVSQAELNRLGSGLPPGAPPQMVRRYPPPPPPPPYYYGPGYYAYPH